VIPRIPNGGGKIVDVRFKPSDLGLTPYGDPSGSGNEYGALRSFDAWKVGFEQLLPITVLLGSIAESKRSQWLTNISFT
jgi:hypothetical protein